MITVMDHVVAVSMMTMIQIAVILHAVPDAINTGMMKKIAIPAAQTVARTVNAMKKDVS